MSLAGVPGNEVIADEYRGQFRQRHGYIIQGWFIGIGRAGNGKAKGSGIKTKLG